MNEKADLRIFPPYRQTLTELQDGTHRRWPAGPALGIEGKWYRVIPASKLVDQ